MDWKSESIAELAMALAQAQPKVKAATKDQKNPGLNNRKYATLGSTWDAVREALNDHGLSVVQLPVMVDKPVTVQTTGGEVVESKVGAAVDTVLLHKSGEWLRSRTMLDYSPNEKAIKPMQALGSAITYARRYGLAAMLGVCSEDDDGEASGYRQQDRQTRRPAPETTPEPPAKPDALFPYLTSWNTFSPIANDSDRALRRAALLEALIEDAVNSKRIEAPDLMTDGFRDGKKIRSVAAGIYKADPEYAGKVWKGFLEECRREKEAAL